MINILIVDDHQLVGEGTKQMLASEPEFNVKVVVSSQEVKELAKDERYDLYIIDLNMPEKNGLQLSTEILSIDPNAKILIYTGLDISPYFNHLIDLGVSGFISKTYTKEQLIRSVWSITEGFSLIPTELISQLRQTDSEVQLKDGKTISITDVEKKVMFQVAEGLRNDDIAVNLSMSKRNVERYLTDLFKKLQVSSRQEAIKKGRKLGLIPEVLI
ncbi:response regulator [Amphibacillus sp. Q70]|uniref:response regulator n=1 Tax=Amphibacillus sp. Q70 TaxID=3453416 RepID=UPI003F85E8C7